jgi:hypothetical protein
VVGFKGVFNDNIFGDSVVDSISYMLFKTNFEVSTSLTSIRFST